jgi:predicted RNA binding protein YcfA (HicA-like mRNA interferase family)
MSEIDFSRLRSLTTRRIIQALRRDGFELVRQTESHRHFHHSDGRFVTVSYHRSSDTYAIGMLRMMLETQAKWTEDDLRRLGLL